MRDDERPATPTGHLVRAAPPGLSRAVASGSIYFIGNAHADHGRGLADGRADRLVLPGRAGADGGVPADVPAGAAGRRAGRHHRPAPPDPGRAGGAGGHRRAAGGAAARRLGGPATLLFFIFVAGCCTAMLSPAWNSTIVDSVPRDELPQAITAIGIAYNAARALGPALAGLVFALAGSAWVFVLAVLGLAGHAAGHPALAAAAAPAVAPAGRAPVGRHAQRAALRAPLADGAGAAGAHRGLQRAPARRCGRCCR